MKIRKLISKKLDHDADGVQATGSVNAAISASVNEEGSSTSSRIRSRQRIVQRSGRTVVSEQKEERR